MFGLCQIHTECYTFFKLDATPVHIMSHGNGSRFARAPRPPNKRASEIVKATPLYPLLIHQRNSVRKGFILANDCSSKSE